MQVSRYVCMSVCRCVGMHFVVIQCVCFLCADGSCGCDCLFVLMLVMFLYVCGWCLLLLVLVAYY